MNAENKLRAWNALQAEQSRLRRNELKRDVAKVVLSFGRTGCSTSDIRSMLRISDHNAKYALAELRSEGVIELNGARGELLRWGPPGIRAHFESKRGDRMARVAEKARERSRKSKAKRRVAKAAAIVEKPRRSPVVFGGAPLNDMQKLVERVPASVWDYAQR